MYRLLRVSMLLLLPTAVFCAGCRAPEEPAPADISISGATMGTWYNIKVSGPNQDLTAERLQPQVDARLEEINLAMSTYLPESEISRFNRFRGGEWFEVSPDTMTVVAKALQVSDQTDGAFDVTVGPLVNLWSFGPEDQPERIPTDDEIADAKAKTGFRLIEVRRQPPALRKTLPEVYIDLSGIAKGFAVDAIAELFELQGIERFMIEIGGEVRTSGRKQDGTPWRIGIESPVSVMRGPPQQIVDLENCALATSGDYRNYFEQDGRRYSHTIDPRTGSPIEHRLASVSVISADCMTADAMATALSVMGPDDAYQHAEEHKLDVLLIIRESDGFAEKATDGFERHMAQKAPE